MTCYLYYPQSFLKISLKPVHNFLSNLLTDKQTQTPAKATDWYQNLLACYLYHPQSFLKIPSKSIHKFSSYMLTDRQTAHGLLPKSNQLFLISDPRRGRYMVLPAFFFFFFFRHDFVRTISLKPSLAETPN